MSVEFTAEPYDESHRTANRFGTASAFIFGKAFTIAMWLAVVVIISGTLLGQTSWERVLGRRWVPVE